LVARRAVVPTLLAAGAVGVVIALAGGPVPEMDARATPSAPAGPHHVSAPGLHSLPERASVGTSAVQR
jgi:hypothetical protein